jgi:hypothetical protein
MKSLTRPRTSFRPRVESLEDRCVPTTLTLAGNGSNEIFDIRDNGDGDLTVIRGRAADVLAGRGTFSTHANITKVEVRAKGGNDIVRYLQTGDRTRSMTLDVQLGAGRDVFFGDLEGDLGNNRMTMAVNGGHQGDVITVDATTDRDRIDPAADPIGVDIGSFGALILDLDGGGKPWPPTEWSVGRDTINFDYRGVLDGLLMFEERGGGGPDRLHADIRIDCDSDGVLAGLLNGGQGNDHLFFHITEACSHDRFSIALAEARGGGGHDTFDLTPNVRRR